jgi:hypothetical protein
MTNNASDTARDRSTRWKLAVAIMGLTSTAGLILAVQQFVLKFLWDQSAHTRTAGGILFMLLGAFGICLPILLARQKARFLALTPSRQWMAAFGIPLCYVSAFVLCMEASMRSATLILPRPFTPTAVLRYDPGDARVQFQGGWKPRLESGYNDAVDHGGRRKFFVSFLSRFFKASAA